MNGKKRYKMERERHMDGKSEIRMERRRYMGGERKSYGWRDDEIWMDVSWMKIARAIYRPIRSHGWKDEDPRMFSLVRIRWLTETHIHFLWSPFEQTDPKCDLFSSPFNLTVNIDQCHINSDHVAKKSSGWTSLD